MLFFKCALVFFICLCWLVLHPALAFLYGTRQAATLNNIGSVCGNLGDQPQALLLFVDVGDPYGESNTRSNMAALLWERGERDEASAHM